MNTVLTETVRISLWEVCFVIVVLAFALLLGCLFAVVAAPVWVVAYAVGRIQRVRHWV